MSQWHLALKKVLMSNLFSEGTTHQKYSNQGYYLLLPTLLYHFIHFMMLATLHNQPLGPNYH